MAEINQHAEDFRKKLQTVYATRNASELKPRSIHDEQFLVAVEELYQFVASLEGVEDMIEKQAFDPDRKDEHYVLNLLGSIRKRLTGKDKDHGNWYV